MQILELAVREAAVVRACEHKHVITLHGAYQGSASQAVYLVLDFHEKTLARELLLNARGLPLPKAKVVMWQLLQAVAHLHAKGVSHALGFLGVGGRGGGGVGVGGEA